MRDWRLALASGRLESISGFVRNRGTSRQNSHMETAQNFRLRDLFWEAVLVELRVLSALGQAVAGVAVFILVQLMNVVRYPAAFVVDSLSLLLGFEIGAIVGIGGARVGTDVE